MRAWFYTLATGHFTGDRYDGDSLQANTPPGCGAAAGVTDWQSQRVDLFTGSVVDWQPPAPPDDEMQTWEWHSAQRRWKATPTLAAIKARRIERVQEKIDRLELAQARPVREILKDLLANTNVGANTRARLQEIITDIGKLQDARAAMAAATTLAELEAIPWP